MINTEVTEVFHEPVSRWDIRIMCSEPALVTLLEEPNDPESAFVADVLSFEVADNDGRKTAVLTVVGMPLFGHRINGCVTFTRGRAFTTGEHPDYSCPQWARDAVREAIPTEFHHYLEYV
jgi:hypothetical protein